MFRSRALATLTAAFAAATLGGCQDYNFNPVGRCVFQPTVKQATLENISIVDMLFVVDDSGSMAGEQANLGDNFGEFIRTIADENRDRVVNRGLQPLAFHIAITTTSVFANWDSGVTCVSGRCNAPALSGRIDPATEKTEVTSYACAGVEKCGWMNTHYWFPRDRNNVPTCDAGHAVDGEPYPAGQFVAAPGNPRVLHLDFPAEVWNAWTPTTPAGNPITDAIAQFSQNVRVGTCGSPQEQGLEAARLAIQKAVDGQQQGIQRTEWPHANAKLVVVFVGDEDDCSTSSDPTRSLIYQSDGVDRCAEAALQSAPTRLFPLTDYTGFFGSLDRDFSVAFIVSTQNGSCSAADLGATCLPGICCGGLNACSNAESGGRRFISLANGLRALPDTSEDILAASICGADPANGDTSFASTLQEVARLARPIDFFQLPTTPAANQVTLLRILDSSGRTRVTCEGPASSENEAGKDWWFIDCATRDFSPAPTACVHIEPGGCERNPGEAFSAEYLGKVPADGCTSAADCFTRLGGASADDWLCDGATATRTGTCQCNAR